MIQMIIFKCDLCKKKVEKIDSIVLYKSKIDYCKNCEAKANKIKKAVVKSINYHKEQADKEIEKSENVILGRYK